MTSNISPPIVDAAHTASFPNWPVYTQDEINVAASVLRSGRVNYWTGTEGRAFELEFADYVGTEYAVAVSNGSVALGAALRSLDLPPGAEIIVTPRTFIATVSEIVLAGAIPVFADVDEDSQNLTADTILTALTEHTAAILIVHLAGWPCDMPRVCALAQQHGLFVIEDCAQAHGAAIENRKVGTWGDIATFSFCQDKIMTTGGEGGMIVTDREELSERCWSFKDHGKSSAVVAAPSSGPGFRWVHESIGTNFRLTEFQSAIGRVQLNGLDDAVAWRNRNAAVLFSRLADVKGLRLPRAPAGFLHAFYKFYVFVEPNDLSDGWSRDRILSEMVKVGIPCGSGICPEVYLEQAFTEPGVGSVKSLPVAHYLGQTSIMLRVDPALTSRHMHLIADRLIDILERAC